MRHIATALYLWTLGGCYLEARVRGDVTGSSGSAIGGSLVEGVITGGFAISSKSDAYRVLLGGGVERALASTRMTAIGRASAPRLDLGIDGPKLPQLPDFTSGYELRFGLAGWSGTEPANVSELRLGFAARLGNSHVAWLVGPSLSYWDVARGGTALGAGAETAIRISGDPTALFSP